MAELRYPQTAAATDGVTAALDGRTGRVLWRQSTPGVYRFSIATVGSARVRALVVYGMTVSLPSSAAAGAPVVEVSSTVTALAARDGRLLWTRGFAGQVLLTPTSGFGETSWVPGYVRVTFPAGMLRQPHGDAVLLAALTSMWSPDITLPNPPVALEPFTLVGDTGRQGVRGPVLIANDIAYAAAVGDVNGDGAAEFAVVEQHALPDLPTTTSVVKVVSGATGSDLWSISLPLGEVDLLRLQDVTGDGRPDLLVANATDDPEASPAADTVTAYTGSTGHVVWTTHAEVAYPLGDVQPGGRAATAVASTSFDRRTANPDVIIRAVSGTGRTLWTHREVTPQCRIHGNTADTSLDLETAGDIDGDDEPDLYLSHACFPGTTDGYAYTTVINGRSGRSHRAAFVNDALGASLDGHGDDLLDIEMNNAKLTIRAIDGASGHTLWTRSMPHSYLWALGPPAGTTPTSSRVPIDLILTDWYTTTHLEKLRGRTGHAVWSISIR